MHFQQLKEKFKKTRKRTEELCQSLETEDYVIQAMPDASPVKWHLAHTTWFFEAFVLREYEEDYQDYHPQFNFLFNSYYNLVGPQWHRPSRGFLSRPTVSQVYDYRSSVDEKMDRLFRRNDGNHNENLHSILLLGINHEQQHQELLLTDIKYNLSINPLRPVFATKADTFKSHGVVKAEWIPIPGGKHKIGFRGDGFCFDNEKPSHSVLVDEFKLQNRLVNCREYIEFIRDGGYCRPEIWLSDGWEQVQNHNWKAPLYWEELDGQWHLMTLSGFREVKSEEPVCHISHFEADAFATWAGKRLPTESEWEIAAVSHFNMNDTGNFSETDRFHPSPPRPNPGKLLQMFGEVWEWTSSAYLAYPRYSAGPGAVGEYNGKFMSGQMVLRGGSVATPEGHVRPTYRNFFHPDKRWQFSGIRLADNA